MTRATFIASNARRAAIWQIKLRENRDGQTGA